MSITKTRLPAFQVVTYARDFLLAAQILEEQAISGKTDLFSVAAMNAGLASEQYLKSFLVEQNPASPSNLKLIAGLPKNKHDLFGLYQKIPPDLCSQLHDVSERLSPGFPLIERIKQCSQLFTHTRYGYEADFLAVLRSEVFELAPHLDRVLTEMTKTAAA
jgi:hypothetical protein